MYDGVYEVREYINGRTDWYPHYFDTYKPARDWIEENLEHISELGADIMFRRFDPAHEPEER